MQLCLATSDQEPDQAVKSTISTVSMRHADRMHIFRHHATIKYGGVPWQSWGQGLGEGCIMHAC